MTIIRKVSSVCVYVLFLVLILEGGTRVGGSLILKRHFRKYMPKPVAENMEILFLDLFSTEYASDPVCYFLPKEHRFFRGPQGRMAYAQSKKNDEIRILCLGDSTTYDVAVTYEKSWPYVLEQKLSAHFPDKKINVLNAGLPGSHARQVKRIFQFYLAAYNPDIVIWRNFFEFPDTLEVVRKHTMWQGALWYLFRESRFLRLLLIMIENNVMLQRPIIDSMTDYILGYREIENTTENPYPTNFHCVLEIARRHGIPHVVPVDYVMQNRSGIDDGMLWSNYEDYAARGITEGVWTIDAFNRAVAEYSFKDLFVDECHLTEKGSLLLADEIYTYLINAEWIETIGEKGPFARTE